MSQQTAEQVVRELKVVREELTGTREKLGSLADTASALAKEDGLPFDFVGKVSRYRFTAGAKGEMPRHRFELETRGGLWLYVDCPGDVFDTFLMSLDDDGKEMDGTLAKRLNGKLIMVRRNPDLNRVEPVSVLPDALKARDARGDFLWKGCAVSNASYTGTCVVIDDERGEPNVITVEVEGRGATRSYGYDCRRLDAV